MMFRVKKLYVVTLRHIIDIYVLARDVREAAKIAAGRGEITSIKLIGEAHYDAEETD